MPTNPRFLSRRALVVGLPSLVCGCASAPRSEPVLAGDWTPFVLPGKRETRYTAVQKDGRAAWHAHADSSASMLRRQLPLQPAIDRRVEFSWLVPRMIPGADLSQADRADSPVRVVFAFDGDHSRLPARTRMQFQMAEMLTGEPPPYATLMYVWDNHAPVESILHSPRSDRIRKVVLDTGDQQLGRWRTHRRQLTVDYRRAFGEEPGRLLAVALMTDADNTRSRAEAWYSDIVLI